MVSEPSFELPPISEHISLPEFAQLIQARDIFPHLEDDILLEYSKAHIDHPALPKHQADDLMTEVLMDLYSSEDSLCFGQPDGGTPYASCSPLSTLYAKFLLYHFDQCLIRFRLMLLSPRLMLLRPLEGAVLDFSSYK